jgi:hypothetical protein
LFVKSCTDGDTLLRYNCGGMFGGQIHWRFLVTHLKTRSHKYTV